MCGLVGMISSNFIQKHKECMTDLLYFSALRGRDSTGVAAIRYDRAGEVFKRSVEASEFIQEPRYTTHLKMNDWGWIGHNRYATVGRNTKHNAHPFMVLDEDTDQFILVGAHNGTLKNKHDLTNHLNFGTDSEALYNEIANIGIEEALAKSDGAWALTWFDAYADEFRFIRNKERTLYYAWDKDHKTMMWASEQWMIRVACLRNGIEIENDNVFSFAEDTLYRIPRPTALNQKLTVERKGGIVGKPPSFFHTGFKESTEHWWDNRKKTDQTHEEKKEVESSHTSTQQQDSGNQSNTKETNKQQNDTSSNVTPINSGKTIYKGFGGTVLTKKEFDDLVAGGCSWCQLEFIDPKGKYAWLDESSPVCAKCLNGEHMDEDEVIARGVKTAQGKAN